MKDRAQPIYINRRSFLKGIAVAGLTPQVTHSVSGNGPGRTTTSPTALTEIYYPAQVVTGAPNPIVAENQLPGTPNWAITQFLDDIEGYASETSVVAGDTLTLFVNTTATTFDVLIYRAGYYGGIGARLMAEVQGLSGVVQPAPTVLDRLKFVARRLYRLVPCWLQERAI